MGYLEGFVGGFGKGAKDVAHNMLEAQLKKYESASRIWQAMAQDENYHPAIRQKFFKNAQDLMNYDPYNRESSKKAQELLKLDPNAEASRAYEAMKMLNVDPESLALYDQFGYRDPMAMERMRNEASLAREKEVESLKVTLKQQADAVKQGEIEKLIQEAFGTGQTKNAWGETTPNASGADSEFRNKQAAYVRLLAALGSRNVGGIVNPTQTAGGIVYQDPTGTMHSAPGVMLGGEAFRPTPEGPTKTQPVAHGSDLRLQQGQGGRIQWVAPGMAPQESGVVRDLPQSATFTQEDAISGTRQSETRRGYGGVSSAAPVGPPASTAPTTPQGPSSGRSNSLELRSRPTTTYPGKIEPSYADRKYFELNPTERKKVESSFRGVSHVGRIVDMVERFRVKHGTTPTGPVRGRINEWLNRIGWGDAINRLTEVGRAMDAGEIPPQVAGSMIDSINNEIAQRAQTIIGEGGPAEDFAEIVTLTRSLNGLELISMSGSGNGITRLYQMMERALLNPYQDPQLLRGHARGVTFLFTEPIKRWLMGTGRGWQDVDPESRRIIENLGLAEGMPGYSKPNVSKTYKTYSRGQKTKRRYGSDDGINFFDVETGKPYDPRNEQ